MTDRAPKNITASVHQRLKNKAQASNQRFNDLLQHHGLERFLSLIIVLQDRGSLALNAPPRRIDAARATQPQ